MRPSDSCAKRSVHPFRFLSVKLAHVCVNGNPAEWLNLGLGAHKCPFPLNRGNRYKDYRNIFPGQNFVSREWRCPLNRGALMERFHCSQDKQNRKSERKRKNPSGTGRERAPLPSPRLSSSPFSFTSCDSSCLLFVSFFRTGTDYRL